MTLELHHLGHERARPRRDRGANRVDWFVAAGVLWIAGAIAEDGARTLLWVAALGVDYAAPLVTFWVPGRPRLNPDAWEVGTAHFAERCTSTTSR